MLNFLKREANKTYTENNAVTFLSTQSDCLDLFATIGALRDAEESEIISRFQRAYAEDSDLAMKILFYGRDVRGGLGERRVFRTIISWLAGYNKDSVVKNIPFFAEYGRFDDLLILLDTPCRVEALQCIREQLAADLEALQGDGNVSLLGKWLPSVNASSLDTVRNAKAIARALGMNDAQYRKTLSSLRAKIKIIENNLREKDYTFDYEKQPSKAMFKYRGAFIRNDEARYMEFLDAVSAGKAHMHTGTLMPYDIIRPIVNGIYGWSFAAAIDTELTADERKAIDTSWNALEDFGNGENAIAVVDGSGSMYCGGNPMPATVALSLGIYFAEHNRGAFRNHFITFSEDPQLVEIKGKDIVDKVTYCEGFNEIANTNIRKVFELILKTAVKNRVPQEQLPKTIYIISDMEFDSCSRDADLTNFKYAKKRYARRGYQLPQVVFWNVQSRNRQQPVTMNEQGVVLVSGCTPRLFSMITSGEYSPYQFMMEVMGSERYADIAA